jgi:MFS family permease
VIDRARRASSPRRVLLTVLAGVFGTGYSMTILAVSLGDIATSLGTSTATLTWAVTGPLLGFVVAMPIAGKTGDLRGHRRLFLVGTAASGLFTLGSIFAWNAISLIVVRTMAGASVGALMPSSMALLLSALSLEDRPRAIGLWAGVGAGAPVVGLVLGGPMVDTLGWRSIFAVQAPIIAAVLVLAWRVVPETPRREHVSIDVRGAVLLGFTTVSALFALDRGGRWGFDHPVVIVGFALAPITLMVFLRHEGRVPEPVVPLVYFRVRTFWAPVASSLFANMAYMGSFIIGPALARSVLGFSVSGAAFLMIIRPGTSSAASAIVGRFINRVGERRCSTLGLVLLAGGLLATGIGAHEASTGWVVLGLGFTGTGGGIAFPPMAALVARSVAEHDLGAAGAANQMLAQVGVTIGIQMVTVIMGDVRSPGRFTVAYTVLTAITGVAFVFALAFGGPSRGAGRSPVPRN